MMKKRLTKMIDNLEAKQRDYVEWHPSFLCFHCCLRSSGMKTLIAKCRIGGRNVLVKRVTIGSYGKLTVEEARDMATEVIGKARLGQDTAEKRVQLTGVRLCDEYLDYCCELKRASTFATDKGRIEGHINPQSGRMLVGNCPTPRPV